jgi:hypothetical protein
MIIPRTEPARSQKVKYILDCCLQSQQTRISLYDRRRRYFLFGTYSYEPILYNRLMSHTDLVASFLYAADHARYTVAAPPNSPPEVVSQMEAVEDCWNDEFRDSGLAFQITLALLWALVYDSVFFKLGWHESRDELYAKMITPHNFGVYDESEPDLDSQEAFVHTYHLNWDNAVLRLIRAGKKSEIKRLSTSAGPTASLLPPALANLLITATGGANLSGPIMGQSQTNYQPNADYEPRSDAVMVAMHELWVWDDLAEDYVTFTVAENDIILSDSRETIEALAKASKAGEGSRPQYASHTNIFMKQDHPFVQFRPYELPEYFWGESHCDRLIKLQDWTNGTLDNIREVLERQIDPAKVFSGFNGLSDEKAGALGGPGTWVLDMMPGAKVEELRPPMPPDIFAEFKSIGEVFLEASGLTETVSGKGEAGVRGKGHARQLAVTGSARIRKVAVGLEPALVRLADLSLSLMRRNDPQRLVGQGVPGEFLLAQVGDWRIRIAGHSHSPLFADEAKEESILLKKADAIDREQFIRLRNPPNAAVLIAKLRQRIKAEQAAKAAEAADPTKQAGKPGPKGKNGVAPAMPV